MKVEISKCIGALNALNSIEEQRNQDGTIARKGVNIPAEKSRTGYWMGRLAEKLKPIQKEFQKQSDKLLKDFGTPIMTKVPNPTKPNEALDVESGRYNIPPEKMKEYTEAIDKLLSEEEEIDIKKFDFEMFDKIELPTTFWNGMTSFIEEPKS
jgi:hypothetical protein